MYKFDIILTDRKTDREDNSAYFYFITNLINSAKG